MDLGSQPEPRIEPAEPAPGGVDAVVEFQYEPKPMVPDIVGVGDGARRDLLPDEVATPEQTDQGATSDGASEPEKESPA